MMYRFISFRTYGSGAIQYDSKAFMSNDMKKLIDAIFYETKILLACGHTDITVHSTCDAETAKKELITIYKL